MYVVSRNSIHLYQLLEWINDKINQLADRYFDDEYATAMQLIEAHKQYKTVEKPEKNEAKLDNETLFNHIITKLKTNNRKPWTAPSGFSIEEVDQGTV